MATFGASTSVPIFSDENYDYWSIKMKTFFISQDLWDVVERGLTVPAVGVSDSTQSKQETTKDAKALFILQQAVSESIFPRLMRAETSKAAWEILQAEFQGNTKVKLIKLQGFRREFENLKMKESEAVKEYDSRLIELVDQMRAQVYPEKYDHVVAAIEESKDLQTLSVTELMRSLQAHEQRLARRNDGSLEHAFQSRVNLKNKKAKDYKKKPQKDYKNSDQVQMENKMKGKMGEFPPCDTRTINKLTIQKKKENEHLFFACQALTQEENIWFIDSGCSNHMATDEAIFTDLDTSIKAKVKMGNGELVESRGKGTVAISTKK
ncbi:hypothetical protein F2P56_022961, partial [Juglans regia]